MDMTRFKSLSAEEQCKSLLSTIRIEGLIIEANKDSEYEYYKNNTSNIISGHSEERHQDIDLRKLIGRIVEEGHTVGVFKKGESAREFACELIEYKIGEVADWIEDRTRRRLELTCDMRELIGYGVDTDFNEKQTSVLTVILQKDIGYDNDLGFRVVTAYPNIEHEKAELTGRNYKEIGKQEIIRNSSYACKAFWAAKKNKIKAIKLRDIGAEKRLLKDFKTKDGTIYRLQIINKTKFRVEKYNNQENRYEKVKTDIEEELPTYIREYINSVVATINSGVEKIERCEKISDKEYKKMYDKLNEENEDMDIIDIC